MTLVSQTGREICLQYCIILIKISIFVASDLINVFQSQDYNILLYQYLPHPYFLFNIFSVGSGYIFESGFRVAFICGEGFAFALAQHVQTCWSPVFVFVMRTMHLFRLTATDKTG